MNAFSHQPSASFRAIALCGGESEKGIQDKDISVAFNGI
jgi:hypothetical protein